VTPIGPEQNLSDLLAAGEIDAVLSASQPSCFGRSPDVAHLFPDFQQVEQDWYARTQVFPIMYVIVLRRDVFEAHPWIARSLYKAFDAALQIAYADLRHRNALKVMLPWLQQHLADTLRVLGEGYWDYGLGPNRHVLELFARYSHEQGLAARVYRPEEIVLAQAEDSFRL
jgi:4,5-dihydroxyphthalate decarboxylase